MPPLGNRGPMAPREMRQAAARKATGGGGTPKVYAPKYNPPGVEHGVVGKERRFQQSRQFGPGPIKPYVHATGGVEAPPRTNSPVYPGSGVYHGGSHARPIPNSKYTRRETPT